MSMIEGFQLARLKRGADMIGGVHDLPKTAAEHLANNPQTRHELARRAVRQLYDRSGPGDHVGLPSMKILA
jgi:hypothetical protein